MTVHFGERDLMGRQVTLGNRAIDRLIANKTTGESYSDTIMRLVPEHPSPRQRIMANWYRFAQYAEWEGVERQILMAMQETLVRNLPVEKRTR